GVGGSVRGGGYRARVGGRGPGRAGGGDSAPPPPRRWAATIGSYDGFVLVTPEYNHSVPAALKNAIDYLFAEWNGKAVGLVGYGLQGGVRAIEALRLVMAEVGAACVRSSVARGLFTDFAIHDITHPGRLAPGAHQEPILARVIDEVVAWSQALAPLRARARQTDAQTSEEAAGAEARS